MTENPATEQTPEASDEEALLNKLSSNEFKGEANNGSLRSALNWDPLRYWSVRNRLLENGRVQKAHGGPGGKTILAPTIESTAPQQSEGTSASDTSASPLYPNEPDLYDPMLLQIDSNWSRDEGYDSRITRKTAMSGSRNTGGKWTRPDISVVAIQKFKFLRDPVFDVISFEIKPIWQITVEGVFEALAHRQYTTRAYTIFHTSVSNFNSQPEANRIIALAEQHGVGIILAENPADYDSWVEQAKARRWSPDPADLNEFIQRVFPPSDHDEIIKLTK